MEFELMVEQYYESPINGRIGFRQKKDVTKKDVCLTNGRLGFRQKKWTKTKISPPFTVMTKKDGVGMNGRIGSRQIKVGVEQTVEQSYDKKRWGLSEQQNRIQRE